MTAEYTPPPPYYDNEERKTTPQTAEIPDDKSLRASSRTLKTFSYLSGLNRAVGALLIILVVAWIGQNKGGFAEWGRQRFNWHPMLMILGMVFLYSNGMLIYRTHRNIGMQRLNAIHAGIILFCLACTIAGLVIGIDSHWEGGSILLESDYWRDESVHGSLRIPDMYTLHSWVGLSSIILFFCQCIAGFVSFMYPGINPHLQAKVKRWYVYLGTGSFGGGVVASLLGFNDAAILDINNGRNSGENTLIFFIYLTLIAFGGLSLYLLLQDRFKRLARPGDDEPMSKKAVFGEFCDSDKEICCLPWTPNDCARSVRLLFDKPIHSDPIIAQTVEIQSPTPSVIKD